MNEAELIESATAYYALSSDSLSLYLTATTGFLIAAYMIGAKLTRVQLIVISSLYLIFSTMSSYLAIGYGLRGLSYMALLEEANSNTESYATITMPIAMGVFLFGGILACLKFMWDVRHPKIE